MHWLWMLLIGLSAGAIARYILPREVPGGVIVTTFVGLLGSVVATYLGQFIGWYQEGETAGLLGAVAGSLILLEAYVLVNRINS